MLPAANRMRRAEEFSRAFDGVRARHGTIELILASVETKDSASFRHTKVGFVVSKKVGNSVTRHRIIRQCRHIIRLWINKEMLKTTDYLVVRALPGTAGKHSAVLAHDMECALSKCRRKHDKREAGGKI